LRQVVDDNTVRRTGETYSATLVLWGWYDALTITPRMERIKIRTEYRSTGEGKRFKLTLTNIEFMITTDVPQQVTYIALFTLGLDKYDNADNDTALGYFNGALATGPNVTSEAYFYRGNIYYTKRDYNHYLRRMAEYSSHRSFPRASRTPSIAHLARRMGTACQHRTEPRHVSFHASYLSRQAVLCYTVCCKRVIAQDSER
jgi:hypothetical protein